MTVAVRIAVLAFATVGQQLPAQSTPPAEASARAEQPGSRSFPIAHVGRIDRPPTGLLAAVAAELTPNAGSMQWFPEQHLLVVEDTPARLAAIAATVARLDVAPKVEPAQVLLDFVKIDVADYRAAVRALAGRGLAAQHGAAILAGEQKAAVVAELQAAGAVLRQAPKIVALAGQTATIFVGDGPATAATSRETARTSARLDADGCVRTPLSGDGFEFQARVEVLPGSDRLAICLQVRTARLQAAGALWSQTLLLGSGQLAVVQPAAGGQGELLLVTAHRIQAAAAPAK